MKILKTKNIVYSIIIIVFIKKLTLYEKIKTNMYIYYEVETTIFINLCK
jgi:hypothetical protein